MIGGASNNLASGIKWASGANGATVVGHDASTCTTPMDTSAAGAPAAKATGRGTANLGVADW